MMLCLHVISNTNDTANMQINLFITHAPVHINDFRGVRARYVERTG